MNKVNLSEFKIYSWIQHRSTDGRADPPAHRLA